MSGSLLCNTADMNHTHRPLTAAILAFGLSLLLTACSSGSDGPSMGESDALARCHDLVVEKYAKDQRPPKSDSESVRQEGREWKISGMVRGTKPSEVDENGAPVGQERTSKDMAHMKFECTVSDEASALDTWRLANQQDIAEAEAMSETAVAPTG